ncbi:hypothetical protein K435DRAFT_677002, partial [Dendrothele bispora CBS 962.96]
MGCLFTPSFPNNVQIPHVLVCHNHKCSDKGVDQLLERISESYQLNRKQKMAFTIISRSYINRFLFGTEQGEPLKMLLTGPGGTGKTHTVKAVREVMSHFGRENRICFLAPTGSAASLIQGTTIHTGLGIAVGSKANTGDRYDNVYSFSVTKRVEAREEWKDVDIVMVDEVSLLGAQLLAKMDA